jgi:hypothetical protein
MKSMSCLTRFQTHLLSEAPKPLPPSNDAVFLLMQSISAWRKPHHHHAGMMTRIPAFAKRLVIGAPVI